MSEELLRKLCIIGSCPKLQVQFLQNYAKRLFDKNHLPTLGIAMYNRHIKINNRPIKLILVYTSGKQFFEKLRPSYYRGASSVIICFDKSDRSSFYAVNDWYKEFKKYIPQASLPFALVGFLTDSDVVTSEEAQNLAEELNLSYYETQSTDKDTIEDIFHEIGLKLL